MPTFHRDSRRLGLHRRALLRGMASGSAVFLGLPLLDIMMNNHGTALADGTSLPVRFGTFVWGCGIVHRTWVPAVTGTGWTPPATLAPFGGALLPYTSVVTGFNFHQSDPAHIPARQMSLSNSHDLTTGIAGGGTYRGQNAPEPSVDTLVANAWKGLAPHNQLCVRVVTAFPYRGNSSWQAGGANNTFEPSPTAFFTKLFGASVSAPADPHLTYKARMLDAVAQDAKALSTKLGASDRRRLEQHLDSVRSIERRLQDPAGTGCTPPSKPTSDPGDKLLRAQLFADLLAVALACDLTRVFCFEYSANQSESLYPEIGFNVHGTSGMGHHELTHDDSTGDTLVGITNYIFRAFGYLAEKLRTTPDGTGNLLESALVLGTSEHANAGAHNNRDHPFLFVGKARGRFRAGLHYRHQNLANEDGGRVLLTAAHAVGVPVPGLGLTAGLTTRATVPVNELLIS
jgi:hypothetical protein